jgi:hypothetical protein
MNSAFAHVQIANLEFLCLWPFFKDGGQPQWQITVATLYTALDGKMTEMGFLGGATSLHHSAE